SRLNETLHFYDEGGARIVPVTGEYDISNASDFERFMVEWTSQSPVVILDFSTTVYIDSTMLSVLMRQRFALRDRLRVVVPKTARVRKLFDITGLGSVLMVRESLDDALSVSGNHGLAKSAVAPRRYAFGTKWYERKKIV
ncbi:MAG: STAS domain-containing protein, partial [Vulcanimicrobiaceae bacterium]